MNKFFARKKLRGLVAAAAITALLLPSTAFLPAPKPAEAQVGGLVTTLAECLAKSLNLSNMLSGLGAGLGSLVPTNPKPIVPNTKNIDKSTKYVQTKEKCLDNLAWVAAKFLIKEIGDQFIFWINSGFDGNTPFISDPGGFFLGIADSAAANFIFGDNFRFLCSARGAGFYKSLMMPQIKIGLFNQHFGSYRINRTCGLTDIIDNLSSAPAFLAGNRRAGARDGWGQWFAITQIPNNNIYGAGIQAKMELDSRVTGATEINKQVAEWNKGFKSMTKSATDGLSNLIETPGNFVQDQLYRRLQGDVYQLEAADELSEVIDGVVGALVNQLAQKGLADIIGSTGAGSYRRALGNRTFRPLSPRPNSTYSYTDPLDTQTDAAIDEFGNATDLAGSSGADAAQMAKISLYNPSVATASQICDQNNDSARNGAQLAIDSAATYTNSDTCQSMGLPEWWKVVLTTPEYIDEMRYITRSGWPLRSWGPGGVIGPYARFTDTNNVWHDIALIRNSTSGTVTLPTSPENLRTVKMKSVEIFAGTDILLADVSLFRHLPPEVSVQNAYPSYLDAATAAAGFNPITGLVGGAAWVSATYRPLYSDTPLPVPPGSIRVLATDSSTHLYVPLCNGDDIITNCYIASPLSYTLTLPHTSSKTYSFEYVAEVDGIISATSTRSITVLPPPPPPAP